jgi:hypothetical protein
MEFSPGIRKCHVIRYDRTKPRSDHGRTYSKRSIDVHNQGGENAFLLKLTIPMLVGAGNTAAEAIVKQIPENAVVSYLYCL